MRPATAVTKKSQVSARSIWKKYESIKPQKNQFYCFKTISQILQSHQSKTFKDDKKDLYYHKINSPRKQLKQNNSLKDNTQKKFSTIVDRNPTLKKALSNNFFSTKQIGKENNDHMNSTKIKTQNKIDNDDKFLPYRQQSISIIKHSKIMNDIETSLKEQEFESKKSVNIFKNQDKINKKNLKSKQRQKTRHLFDLNQEQNEYDDKFRKKQSEFVIQQWSNFQQQAGNFSMLISNSNILN